MVIHQLVPEKSCSPSKQNNMMVRNANYLEMKRECGSALVLS